MFSFNILDSVLIASECLDSCIKTDIPGVLCKLDITKAFDHVNWKFLLYMLKRCSFGDKWVSWISNCISSARHSVLVNGSPAGFFNSSRRLRQGDPLLPLLFIVVMEGLSKMLSGAVDSGRLSSFSVGSWPPVINISHLLFADDILVFSEANPIHLRYLRVLLVCFEAVSCLKVYLAKSLLVPVGNVDNVAELASILGCGTSSLPLKYLGMPLGARHKAKFIWDDIMVKMERRLASWQKLYLSKGARVPSSRVHSPTSLRISCLFFPFLFMWLTVLRSFKETFFGVG